MNKAEKTLYALMKSLIKKLLSRRIESTLHMAIIRPTLTYGFEVWIIKTKEKLRNLKVKRGEKFENRFLTKSQGVGGGNKIRKNLSL